MSTSSLGPPLGGLLRRASYQKSLQSEESYLVASKRATGNRQEPSVELLSVYPFLLLTEPTSLPVANLRRFAPRRRLLARASDTLTLDRELRSARGPASGLRIG